MLKKDSKRLDYLILSCLVNSDATEQDIVDMVKRFADMCFQCELSFQLNIQNPPAEQKKEN